MWSKMNHLNTTIYIYILVCALLSFCWSFSLHPSSCAFALYLNVCTCCLIYIKTTHIILCELLSDRYLQRMRASFSSAVELPPPACWPEAGSPPPHSPHQHPLPPWSWAGAPWAHSRSRMPCFSLSLKSRRLPSMYLPKVEDDFQLAGK